MAQESPELVKARDNLLRELVSSVGPTNSHTTLVMLERFIDAKINELQHVSSTGVPNE